MKWKYLKDELPPIDVHNGDRIFYKNVLFLDEDNDYFYGFLEHDLIRDKFFISPFTDSEHLLEITDWTKWLDIEFLKTI